MNELEKLLQDMLTEVVFTTCVTMPIPLYERMKSVIADAVTQEVEQKAKQLVRELVEALEFYGDETKYYEHIRDHIFRTTYINEDRGHYARKALAKATKWMEKNGGQ